MVKSEEHVEHLQDVFHEAAVDSFVGRAFPEVLILGIRYLLGGFGFVWGVEPFPSVGGGETTQQKKADDQCGSS